jgi:trimethylamine:corrinoid methyltransferase-like protein
MVIMRDRCQRSGCGVPSHRADAIGVEVIAAVMQTHNFLGQKHTVRCCAGGCCSGWRATSWEVWEREGQEGMSERAQAKAEHLLATHAVPPLSPEQERELDAILEAAEIELVS